MKVIEPQKKKSEGKKFHIIVSPKAKRHTHTAHFQKLPVLSLVGGHQRPRKTFEDLHPNDEWCNGQQKES